MLSKKVLRIFSLIITLTRAAGATPFSWNEKTDQIYVTKKAVKKAQFWLMVHLVFLLHVLLRTLHLQFYFEHDIATINFCLTFLFSLIMLVLMYFPQVVYYEEFVQFVNSMIIFLRNYEGN